MQAIEGYHIDFKSPPYQARHPHSITHTQAERNLIEDKVQDLLTKQAIHPVPVGQEQDGFVSNLFLVPKKGGSQRPVINLKHLNQFVKYEHFKMKNIHMLRDLLKKHDYLVKIYLKDANFTIPIWVNHQKFLRFLWKETLYKFTCSSCSLQGSRTIAPVGDTHCNLSRRQADHGPDSRNGQMSCNNCKPPRESLGFTVHNQKSVLIPSTTIEFLRSIVDSKTLTLFLPKEKIKKAKKASQSILDNALPLIQLSQFLGYLTSTIQAVFPAPIHFRYLQVDKNKALSTCQYYLATLSLSQHAKEELIWWRDNLEAWNGKALVSGEPCLIIETDVSCKGWKPHAWLKLHWEDGLSRNNTSI